MLIKSRGLRWVALLVCRFAKPSTFTKTQKSGHEPELNLEQSEHTSILGEAQLPKLSQRHKLFFISLAL
jgi:hypothetical protein